MLEEFKWGLGRCDVCGVMCDLKDEIFVVVLVDFWEVKVVCYIKFVVLFLNLIWNCGLYYCIVIFVIIVRY